MARPLIPVLIVVLCGCPKRTGEAPVRSDLSPLDREEVQVGEQVESKEKPAVTKRNRLADEKSPYLRQHGTNPVDWYPWGEEAFSKAEKEGKLIFLSIGYSSCHWCHVMEHESFDDEEVGAMLNKHFVCIKLDREERPDVDAIYMRAATEALRVRGGWPLSVWLTPDRKPFAAGTYFPKAQFLRVNQRIADAWADPKAKDQIETQGSMVTSALQQAAQETGEGEATLQIVELARYAAERHSDREQGGWGQGPQVAPKFPNPGAIELLLRFHLRHKDKEALATAGLALSKMAEGGIHDHIGGGFHRYSTTRDWLVPHFEKMLYDNAQLLQLYAWAYRITGNELYRETALDTARWVQREMTGEQGGFYSAQDADDPGGPEGEGGFYVWDPKELKSLLGDDAAKAIMLRYDVTDMGNWDHKPTKSILQAIQPVASVAKEMGRGEEEVRKLIADAREKMYETREKRPKPMTDTKVLAGWNGLMVSGFCTSYQALGEKSHLESAVAAGEFVRKNMWKNGRLFRRWAEGESAHGGVLDDYAWVVSAWLDLYECTFDESWLRDAIALQKKADELFLDRAKGGYFYTPKDGEALIARSKDGFDRARPSGNSVMAENLLRLMHFTGNLAYREQAKKTIDAFGETLGQQLFYLAGLLNALDYSSPDTREIFIAGKRDDPKTMALVEAVWRHPNPNRVVALVTPELEKLLPQAKGKETVNGAPAAYVCRDFTCLAPITEAALLDLSYDKPKTEEPEEEKPEKDD
ncbi:MAG: thioredoxin domain-containing protein [Planctomycetota bacterium]|jgi:uncharacterized protein YyaL (SSP411 family)